MTDEFPPPADLGTEGKALWVDIVAEMGEDDIEPTAAERRYLLDACREADVIASIAAAFQGEPHVVKGSQQQPVAHPLLAELRAHRAVLAGLLARIRFDVPGEAKASPTGHKWSPESARNAARARWDRG